MTDRTLREKISALSGSEYPRDWNNAIEAVLDTITAHTAVQPAPDAVAEAWALMDHFAVVLHEADGKYVSVKQEHYEAARALTKEPRP